MENDPAFGCLSALLICAVFWVLIYIAFRLVLGICAILFAYLALARLYDEFQRSYPEPTTFVDVEEP